MAQVRMAQVRSAGRSRTPLYGQTLRQAMDRLLPWEVLPARWKEGKRWNPRMLALGALLISYDSSPTAQDRFRVAGQCLRQMYPSRKRPGKSYNGFMQALQRFSDSSLLALQAHLRQEMHTRLGPQWRSGEWVILAADGSRINLPDTQAHEDAYGSAGKAKTGPQLLITTLFHLGSSLPWAWQISGAKGSERRHLQQMLGLLPERTLLVADAGFVGYELLQAILQAGHHFLIRVGANAHLLKALGYARREGRQTVYLWPETAREQVERDLQAGRPPSAPPLVLRLIEVRRQQAGRIQRMYLLSSVRCAKRLSDRRARRIYGLRWGIEVGYRALKQTMERRKMCSTSPARAALELNWCMMGLWLVGLLTATAAVRGRRDAGDWSAAEALRVVRRAMQQMASKSPHGGVLGELRRVRKDCYLRTGSKTARHRRDKKKDRPPGRPKARKACASEVRLAQAVRRHRPAA